MKVLMTADSVGGVWTYALELCSALSKQQVQVVLAVLGPAPNAMQRQRALALPNVRLETADYKLEWMHEPWSDVGRAGEWLLRVAERERVDVVHLNGFVHAALPWHRPVLVVAHSCVYTWWRAVHGEDPPSSWNRYRDRVEAGLRHAHVVIAPTQAFLEQLSEHYSFDTPLRTIRNAIAWDGSATACAEENSPLIFASGRLWDEAKNMRTLDAAASGMSWPVHVAGERISPDGKCVELTNVRCLGPQTALEVRDWLERAAIFAHPALYEPFGLSVLEAACSGCALVLGDTPTLRELWDEAAVFVDPRDPRSLRAALEALIADAPLRERLGVAARERASEFTIDAMSREYHACYCQLFEQNARERSVA
jgi:glycogen synthase